MEPKIDVNLCCCPGCRFKRGEVDTPFTREEHMPIRNTVYITAVKSGATCSGCGNQDIVFWIIDYQSQNGEYTGKCKRCCVESAGDRGIVIPKSQSATQRVWDNIELEVEPKERRKPRRTQNAGRERDASVS